MMDNYFWRFLGRSKAANRVDKMGFRQIAFDRALSITFGLFGVYRLESHPEQFLYESTALTLDLAAFHWPNLNVYKVIWGHFYSR